MNCGCGCKEHLGTAVFNNTFDMDVEHVFKCLFEENEFSQRVLEASKITDIKLDDWKDATENDRTIKVRKLEYNIEVSTALGPKPCRTTELRVNIFKFT